MIPEGQWDEEIGCLHQPLSTPAPGGPVVCRWCFALGEAFWTGGGYIGVQWNPATEPRRREDGR